MLFWLQVSFCFENFLYLLANFNWQWTKSVSFIIFEVNNKFVFGVPIIKFGFIIIIEFYL